MADDIIDLINDNATTNASNFSPPLRSASSKANDLPNANRSKDCFPFVNESKRRNSSITPEHVCPKCNQRKLNGDCSLRVQDVLCSIYRKVLSLSQAHKSGSAQAL
jgi:hypothetical protein